MEVGRSALPGSLPCSNFHARLLSPGGAGGRRQADCTRFPPPWLSQTIPLDSATCCEGTFASDTHTTLVFIGPNGFGASGRRQLNSIVWPVPDSQGLHRHAATTYLTYLPFSTAWCFVNPRRDVNPSFQCFRTSTFSLDTLHQGLNRKKMKYQCLSPQSNILNGSFM